MFVRHFTLQIQLSLEYNGIQGESEITFEQYVFYHGTVDNERIILCGIM